MVRILFLIHDGENSSPVSDLARAAHALALPPNVAILAAVVNK